MDKTCEACNFLEQPSHPLFRTKYWNVELGRNHAYPGRAYVTLLEHKGSLSELSNVEWDDFEQLVRKLENAYHKALGARPFNWACLMNNAYKEKPYNPHVHWHLIPRYEKPVQIGDTILIDEEFGHMFTPKKERVVNGHMIDAMIEKLERYL